VLLLNIPFGFWRDGTKRFTLPWLLAVHLPVPFVVGLRVLSTLGWRFTTFPVLIGSFFLGQFLGGKVHQWWQWRKNAKRRRCRFSEWKERNRRRGSTVAENTFVTPMWPLFRRQHAQVVDIIHTMHGMHDVVLVIRWSEMRSKINKLWYMTALIIH
jgi:hypothetical protein